MSAKVNFRGASRQGRVWLCVLALVAQGVLPLVHVHVPHHSHEGSDSHVDPCTLTAPDSAPDLEPGLAECLAHALDSCEHLSELTHPTGSSTLLHECQRCVFCSSTTSLSRVLPPILTAETPTTSLRVAWVLDPASQVRQGRYDCGPLARAPPKSPLV